MNILDNENNSLASVFIFLKKDEALELRDKLDTLLSVDDDRHEHIPSSDYKKEITIVLENE